MIRASANVVRHISLLGLVSLGACAALSPSRSLRMEATQEWAQTLARARGLAIDGRAGQADSLLARYATQYPSAPQAVEANYWRALFDLRSSAANQRLLAAIPLLQAYVSAGPSTEHWMEGDALLRAATRVDTLTRVTAGYLSKGEVSNDAAAAANVRAADAKAEVKAATADGKAQDEEIKRLRDELAKSKDELDRIKKRLAEPPKKPPTGS